MRPRLFRHSAEYPRNQVTTAEKLFLLWKNLKSAKCVEEIVVGNKGVVIDVQDSLFSPTSTVTFSAYVVDTRS